MLEPFKIMPITVRPPGSTLTGKGYRVEWFAKAFAQYLPDTPQESVTPSQPRNSAAFKEIPKRHNENVVTAENPPKMAGILACDVVTGGNREVLSL